MWPGVFSPGCLNMKNNFFPRVCVCCGLGNISGEKNHQHEAEIVRHSSETRAYYMREGSEQNKPLMTSVPEAIVLRNLMFYTDFFQIIFFPNFSFGSVILCGVCHNFAFNRKVCCGDTHQ